MRKMEEGFESTLETSGTNMRHNGHRSLCGCESRHGKMVRFCREHRPLELTEEQRQIAMERLKILEEYPPRTVGYPEL